MCHASIGGWTYAGIVVAANRAGVFVLDALGYGGLAKRLDVACEGIGGHIFLRPGPFQCKSFVGSEGCAAVGVEVGVAAVIFSRFLEKEPRPTTYKAISYC